MADKYVTNVAVDVPPYYYIPITGTVSWLCATEMPDGRCFAVWSNGSARGGGTEAKDLVGYYFDTPMDMLADGVLASTAGTPLISSVGALAAVSVFYVGGQCYINATVSDAQTAWNRLFYADDGNDPLAGFSTYLTLDSAPCNGRTGDDFGLFLNLNGSGGIPHVIGSRWIFPSPTLSSFQSNAFHRFGVWTSEDNGVSFTNRADLGFYAVGGSYMDGMAGQCTTLPNGNILMNAIGNVTGTRYVETADDGVTFTNTSYTEAIAGLYFHRPILNDTVDSYAWRVSAVVTLNNDGTTATTLGSLATATNDLSHLFSIIYPQVENGVPAPRLIYYFGQNKVASKPTGFYIDEVGMG